MKEHFSIKKAGGVLLATLLLMTMCGCGDNKDSQNKDLKDLDTEEYVTLGSYDDLKVEVNAITVDEEACKEMVMEIYQTYYPAENGITNRKVENGDIVNIDYEGYLDGVQFDGGTAQGINLTIGSGMFIPGFEEGVVGMLPGTQKDVNISFPEVYQNNPDLAGKPVTFKVTANYILKPISDETVNDLGIEYQTYDELYKDAYDYMYQSGLAEYDAERRTKVIEAYVARCTFNELPEYLMQKYEANIRKGLANYAASYSVDVETLCTYIYGMSYEDLVKDYTLQTAQQYVAMQAVANKENLAVSDEDLDDWLEGYASSAGYASVEEFVGDISKEEYREYIMYERVTDFLIEKAEMIEI